MMMSFTLINPTEYLDIDGRTDIIYQGNKVSDIPVVQVCMAITNYNDDEIEEYAARSVIYCIKKERGQVDTIMMGHFNIIEREGSTNKVVEALELN